MAKETVKVDNSLEEIKLEKSDKMKNKSKNNKNGNKKTTNKKENGNKQSYLSKVKAEMRQVTWPTKKQVFKYSFAAILMIALLAGFFIGMSALFDLLYALVQGWIG